VKIGMVGRSLFASFVVLFLNRSLILGSLDMGLINE
jgi:hypothetical protein